MIFKSCLSATLNLVRSAQSNNVLKSSETAEAAAESEPEMVPGLGALSEIVKTSGSGTGGLPGLGFAGVIIEDLGKRM
jgi:hypothetical protein